MIVEVDERSPVPPYEQLRSQVAAIITSGSLGVGERLPTIRQLAGDLGIAPGTVQRAYRELEADGLIVSRGRRGTTVAPRASWRADTDVDAALADAVHRFATEVRQLGVDPDTALAAARTHLAALPDPA